MKLTLAAIILILLVHYDEVSCKSIDKFHIKHNGMKTIEVRMKRQSNPFEDDYYDEEEDEEEEDELQQSLNEQNYDGSDAGGQGEGGVDPEEEDDNEDDGGDEEEEEGDEERLMENTLFLNNVFDIIQS